MLATTIICFECFVVGAIIIGPARKNTFSKEFMEQFKEEHQKAFPGTDPAIMGHPDAGDGRYSDKLEYKQWVDFNNRWRVHQNFVEFLPLMVTTLVIGGLFVPVVTMVVAIINALARIIYTIMYATKGSDNRVLAALTGNIPIYLLLVWTLVKVIILAI